MSIFQERAKENFAKGLSCSEAVINAAHETKLCKFNDIEETNQVASMFSGGMSSGCVCGAVAGSQIVLGNLFGRKLSQKSANNRIIASEFVSKFRDKRKVTCCTSLTAAYRNDLKARRENCTNIVTECAEIIEEIIKEFSEE